MSNKASNEVAVIIPVYNEGSVIKDVITSVQRLYQNVVCINDGSTDESLRQMMSTGAYVIDHPINMGQGAAIQTGIEFARTLPVKYFCTFDADGQHDLNDVNSMVKEIKKTKCDIVMGSRFKGNALDIPRSKLVTLKAAIKFTNILTGLKLTDTHNGLRVFNRRVAEELQITTSDMSHASEILEIIASKKYKYVEIPVTIRYTEHSKGKGQSLINAVNIAFDTILRKISK